MRTVAEIFLSYAQFDATGRYVGGMDKQAHHNYGPAYEAMFPDCEAVRMVMEIGITDGSSMKAWREIFPGALIVGLDTQPSAGASCGLDRLEFHIGDQRSREDCLRAAAGRAFDLIVDDACHELDANLLTFSYLWPFVAPGGLYVIEECGDAQFFCSTCSTATIVETQGPFGGIEPLIVVRKK